MRERTTETNQTINNGKR